MRVRLFISLSHCRVSIRGRFHWPGCAEWLNLHAGVSKNLLYTRARFDARTNVDLRVCAYA